MSRIFKKKNVPNSVELQRVKHLPRRKWEDYPEELTELLSEAYCRKVAGFREMTLRPVQAAALADLHDYRGLFGPISVGSGKTLINFLAPAVLESQRPLTLIPAKLRSKTETEWYRLSKHWRLPTMRIESYAKVSRDPHLIENYRPDLIFADEGHRLKNTKAAVTKRVKRYVEAVKAGKIDGVSEVVIAVVSGTLTTESLLDYWHLMRWSLGEDKMPLPAKWNDVMDWADCIDVKKSGSRTAPGALAELCTREERKNLALGGEVAVKTIRNAYRRRLHETPGVVATSTAGVACSLVIDTVDIPLDNRLDSHFKQLRDLWQTPDGWDFTQPIDLWRHARELACGFYNVWDPRPPEDWLEARRLWKKWVRETLKHSRTLDTDMQVAQACKDGILNPVENGVHLYQQWVDIRDSFEPNTVPVWVDDSAIRFAIDWLNNHDGICWTEHPCVGEAIAEYGGFPYFGRGGVDRLTGETIEETSARRVIASVQSNGEGRNLQRWNRNLVLSCVPNGKVLEQLLGRCHRPGQKADTVYYTFVQSVAEHVTGFNHAIKQAKYIETTTGQPQKLLYADRSTMSLMDLANKQGWRWG